MASEPGKLNKKGIWIVAGVVIFIFYSMTNKRDKEVPTVSTAASVVAPEPRVAPPPPPVEEATRVDAIKLWSDYHDNEVAADDQYKGRLLLVDGVVASIDKDFLDHIVIHLKSRNEFMWTMATMKDAEKRTAASLRRGQRVRVQCRGGTVIIGSPTLEDCTFR